MSEHVGQDNGTLRVTIKEAATRLGVTEAAVRKRIQRGSLDKEMGSDGRVYVYLDLSQDKSHPESQVHRDPAVEELVEELRDRVAFLERSLERRSIEAERYQQIVAGLTQTNNQLSARVLELEAPVEPPVSTESREVGAQGRAEAAATPAPGRGGAEAQNGAQRPWWKRMFGG
jgi:hypothetical protein